MPPIYFYAGLLLTISSGLLLVFLVVSSRKTAEQQRMQDVLTRQLSTMSGRVPTQRFRGGAAGFAAFVRSHFGFAESAKFKERLEAAGIRKRTTADILFAAQIALPLLGAFAGSFNKSNTFFCVACGVVAGYLSPDIWLTRQVNKRKRNIRRGIPDAVDLLVICVGAGLGLDQAILRVAEELSVSYPELSEELLLVNLEQRAGKPRLEAWEALALRTKVDEFISFSSMLSQTDRFGTPIIKSLTRFAEDLRTKRRQHAEEAAVKTKVKIIFPLVICIFPCIFIVLLAPAVLTLLTGLKDIGH